MGYELETPLGARLTVAAAWLLELIFGACFRAYWQAGQLAVCLAFALLLLVNLLVATWMTWRLLGVAPAERQGVPR